MIKKIKEWYKNRYKKEEVKEVETPTVHTPVIKTDYEDIKLPKCFTEVNKNNEMEELVAMNPPEKVYKALTFLSDYTTLEKAHFFFSQKRRNASNAVELGKYRNSYVNFAKYGLLSGVFGWAGASAYYDTIAHIINMPWHTIVGIGGLLSFLTYSLFFAVYTKYYIKGDITKEFTQATKIEQTIEKHIKEGTGSNALDERFNVFRYHQKEDKKSKKKEAKQNKEKEVETKEEKKVEVKEEAKEVREDILKECVGSYFDQQKEEQEAEATKKKKK